MFYKFAVRDVILVCLSLVLALYAGPFSVGVGPVSDVVGVVVGFSLGASAFVLHEWGHLVGALITRSVLMAPPNLKSIYLFSFDSKANSRRQFLVMSGTGFVMTALCLWGAFTVLPEDQLATRVARGIIGFLGTLAVVLEFPAVLWACLRSDLPPVETFGKKRQA